MKRPKLYQLLAGIEKSELPWLDKFLDSPFHNSNEELLKIFRFLRPYYPDFHQLSPETVFQHCAPKTVFEPKWVNDRFSELTACVKTFMDFREYEQDRDLQRQLHRRALRRRGFFRRLARQTRRQVSALEARPILDMTAGRKLLELYHEQFDSPAYQKQEEGLQSVNDILALKDLEYLYSKLYYTIDLLARSKTYAEQVDTALLEPLLPVARQLASGNPLLGLYLQLYDLYRTECSEAGYTSALTTFRQCLPDIHPTEAAFLLVKLCSLGISQINRGQLSYIEWLYPLYQLGVEREFFLQKGYFPDDTFLNICTIGAYKQAWAWTEQFIDRYRSFLPTKSEASTLALGRAILAFHAGEFNRVHRLLREVSGRRSAYQLRIRSLTVRCLLELHIQDSTYGPILRSELRAYDRSMRRSTAFSEQRRRAYRNFCAAVGEIADLRDTGWGEIARRKALIRNIERREPIALKSWLIVICEVDQ